MFSIRNITLGSVIASLLLTITSVATAQDQKNGTEPAMTKQEETALDTIVVTAQKREEDVQNVPVSMSVLTEMDITDAGILNVTDLTSFTPNVYSKQNVNQNMLIIRGISSHNVILNTPAGLFVDDINYPMTFMQNPDLMDVERVEVLRGPQGTLYGRNTESGAVNIITKQPGNEFTGKVFIEPSFYDVSGEDAFKYRAGVSVSGPAVEDVLYLGGAFQVDQSDGYVKNIYNGDDEAGKIDHLSGHGKLRWTPSEAWDINLLFNTYESDDGYGYLRYIDGPSVSDRFTINWDGANEWQDENNGQALRVSHTGDLFNVVSTTTRNDFLTDFKNDGEFGAIPFPDQIWKYENTAYSQELRFSSVGDGPFEWLAGVYGFTEDCDVHAGYFGFSIDTEWESEGYALFGQATYTFSDRLHLSAGLRYDYLKSDGEQVSTVVGSTYEADMEHSELLPKVSVSFDATQTIMFYVTLAKGMMAGGYDFAFATDSDTLTFDPEYSWNYEAGMKTAWLDGKFKANAAIYYIDIKDKQVDDWLAGPAVRSITNAANAHSTGVELELEAHPVQGLKLFAGLGYAKAEIDDWVSEEIDGGTYDYSGKRLTYAPEYTFNAGLQYMYSTGFFGRADILGVSNFYTDTKNQTKVDSYKTVNLRIGFEKEAYQIALWCNNIFNEEYLLSKSYYIGGHIAQDGEPRSVGVTLTYRF